MYLIFLSIFGSFLLSFFLYVPLCRGIALRWNILDNPTDIKKHHNSVPYMGGMAIYASMLSCILGISFFQGIHSVEMSSILAILFLIILFGLFDDVYTITYQKKLIFQFLSAGVLLYLLFPSNLFFSIWWIIFILLIVYNINAFNLIDIVDGMSTTVAVISSCFFLFLSIWLQDVGLQVLLSSIIGAGIGFLPYNFSKKKKIFLGDSGSLFLGTLFSYIGLKIGDLIFHNNSISNVHIIIPIFFLIVSNYSFTCTIVFRLLRKENPCLHSKNKPDHLPLIVRYYFPTAFNTVCVIGIFHILYSIVVVLNFLFISNYSYNILVYSILCLIIIVAGIFMHSLNYHRKEVS